MKIGGIFDEFSGFRGTQICKKCPKFVEIFPKFPQICTFFHTCTSRYSRETRFWGNFPRIFRKFAQICNFGKFREIPGISGFSPPVKKPLFFDVSAQNRGFSGPENSAKFGEFREKKMSENWQNLAKWNKKHPFF